MTSHVNDLRVLVDNLDEYIHVPGGIERLKKMILHLAVSGQLVPQDSSEGTGDGLYQQIQSEKAELIKQGTIKKQKPLKEMTNEEMPFAIPVSWKWARLGETYDVRDGTHDTPKYTKKGYPLVTSKNLSSGTLDFSDIKYISEADHLKISERSQVSRGDILFAMIGSIGNPVVVDTDAEFSIKNTALFKPYKNEFYEPKWLLDYLLTATNAMKDRSAGAVQSFVSLGFIRNYPAPLPPVAEQKRIVAKVDSLFKLMDDLAKKYADEQSERTKLVACSLSHLAESESTDGKSIALEHLSEIIRTKSDAKALRQAILRLAVSGRLASQDPNEGTGWQLYEQIQAKKSELVTLGKIKKEKSFSEITEDEHPFTIPRTWRWTRLGEISDIFNGNSINAAEKQMKYGKVSNGYPYLGTKDIGYGFEDINYENGIKIPYDENGFRIISARTTLICSEGGSAGKKCGIIDRDVAFGNKMYAFKAFGDQLLPEFVLYNYLTRSFYKQFSDKMTGIIGGISTANFKLLLLPLPPLSEQKRIVAKTTQLLDLVVELEKHLD